MLASQYYFATLRDAPKDAEIISQKLMLRAGLIRKLGSGLYSWLPLGLKVLRKIETIIREEMQQAGALEILMPAVQPAELWHETGRWDTFGGQLLTMLDSNKRAYCFGPTHEEVITDLLRREVQSYKQLPLNFYQIQTKFRDEIRPRFGVLRAREFIMKDAYSFHLSQESLQKTYELMYQAYCNILKRLGLEYRAVEADTGAIGGYASHEFQVLAQTGEDVLFYSDTGNYAANIELATSQIPPRAIPDLSKEKICVTTPHKKNLAEAAASLEIPAASTLKTFLVKGRQHPIVALVIKGDDELNPLKAAKHPLVQNPLIFAEEQQVLQEFSTSIDYIGPLGLSIPVIIDNHALTLKNFVCGANQEYQLYQYAAFERDLPVQEVFDLRNVKEGEPSPEGQGHLRTCRGIEIGHVFQLGDKYAKAMQATVLNEAGQPTSMQMGCYGLGVSRIVAATIEQHHDDKGIIWPAAIAPFSVVIIPIASKSNTLAQEEAWKLYQSLCAKGLDVLLEDRQERPGVLFADHDLIGIPHRIVISEKLLATGKVEYKARNQEQAIHVFLEEILSYLT